MGCTIRITALLVVFCTQIFISYGSVQPIWSDPVIAENFLGSFTESLLNSGIFSSAQLGDISSISQTILDAFGKSGFSNNISKSKVQALNMAFASSVAEIIVSEDSMVPLSVAISTMMGALRNSMLKTTGGVDEFFLKEINHLINMIAADRLNEGSDLSAATGGRQNDFDVTANARGYDSSSRISIQSYKPDTSPNDGYNAGASGAGSPIQQYSANQPNDAGAGTRYSQASSDVSYSPVNAQSFSQNVGINAFGSTGNLGFGDRRYGQDSTAVASANAPYYSDYSQQGDNRQIYPMDTDRAAGDATANDTPSLSGDTSFYDVSFATRNRNNGGNDREILSSSSDIDVISKFTNSITSSLLSSNDFTSTFRTGLPATTAVNLASSLARSFATQMALDETTINTLLPLVSQYVSEISSSADVSAYANAISRAVGDALASTGNVPPVLTASLAPADTQPIANLVNSVTSTNVNEQQSNLVRRGGGSTLRNIAAKQVQENRQNLGSVQKVVETRIQPSLSRFPLPGASAAANGGSGGAQATDITSTARNIDVISQFTNTITSSLLSSNEFTSIFGSGLPVTTALNLASNLAQSLAAQIGLDETGINYLLSLLRQYISAIDLSADASAYANAVSRAIGNALASAGNLSPALASSLASADTQPIANLVNSVTSSTLIAQQPKLIGSGGASTVGTKPEPSLSGFPGQSGASAAATAAAGGGQGAGTSSTTTDIEVISKFTNTVISSLLSSNDFTSIFGSGLPVTTALNLASNLAQSLATQIGLDEAGINSVLSLLNQYISAIDPSADASTYANALSLAIGNTLASAGSLSPALASSLASVDAQPIANFVSSVASKTLNAQQPNLVRSGGTSTFRNVPFKQVQRKRGNLGSAQSAVGTKLQPSLSGFPGQSASAAASAAAGGGQGVGTSSTTTDIDVISKFTNAITSTLLSSNDFTSLFKSGLPVTAAVNLASNLALSLANQIGLDQAGINSLLSLLSQYISTIDSSADASAYANALSLAIVNTLANAESLSPTLASYLASADTQPFANFVSSVTSRTLNAQQPKIVRNGRTSSFNNIPFTQVEGNRGNLGSVQSAVGTGLQPSLSRYPGQGAIAAASAAAGGAQVAGTSNSATDIDVISKFINTISSSLLSSNDFTSIFGSGLPVTSALNLASNLAHSLATQIGLDEAGINSLLSLLSQYISAIDSSADASAYANALSLAIGSTLASAGSLSPALASSLASADTQRIANFVSSVTSRTLNTQQPNLVRSGVASTFRNAPLAAVQGNRGNLGSVQIAVGTRFQPSLSGFPGQSASAATSTAAGGAQGAGTYGTATDIDVISKFTNTISSSLLSSNDFTSIFGSELPVATAFNLASNLAQSLATQIGLDEAGINSLLSLLSQYISAIGSSGDASAYANALSLAIGNTLASAGSLSPALASSLASANAQAIANFVRSVTSRTLNVQQPILVGSGGVSTFRNVPLTEVQGNRGNLGSVQRAVGTRLQPSLSRFPGQDATSAASTAAGGAQVAGTSSTATDIGVISKFTNTVSSSLLSSNDFTSIFGSGLPVTTAFNLASNLAQSLATQIGLDEAGINSLLSLLSQYISAIGSSADASAYANALSLAIGNTLAKAGNLSPILTASLASADAQPIANLVNSVTSSTLIAQQPNLIRRGGISGLDSAVNPRVTRPGFITAGSPASGATGAAIFESDLIEQVNVSPSAVSDTDLGNGAINSAATSPSIEVGGGSVSPASDVGSSVVSAASSLDPSTRISSAASSLVSGRTFNPSALPTVISFLANQIYGRLLPFGNKSLT
ncbi:hypothetical protein X975_06479, partial [Stegodyphus mimosarum]